jgi:hypothetical protein
VLTCLGIDRSHYVAHWPLWLLVVVLLLDVFSHAGSGAR